MRVPPVIRDLPAEAAATLAALRDRVAGVVATLRRLAALAALAAVACALALTGTWAVDGGPRTVVALGLLLVCLVPAAAVAWLATSVQGAVDAVTGSADVVRRWTGRDGRDEAVARIGEDARALRDAGGRTGQVRALVRLLRTLHAEVGEVAGIGSVRTLASVNPVAVGAAVLVGVGGSLVLVWSTAAALLVRLAVAVAT